MRADCELHDAGAAPKWKALSARAQQCTCARNELNKHSQMPPPPPSFCWIAARRFHCIDAGLVVIDRERLDGVVLVGYGGNCLLL